VLWDRWASFLQVCLHELRPERGESTGRARILHGGVCRHLPIQPTLHVYQSRTHAHTRTHTPHRLWSRMRRTSPARRFSMSSEMAVFLDVLESASLECSGLGIKRPRCLPSRLRHVKAELLLISRLCLGSIWAAPTTATSRAPNADVQLEPFFTDSPVETFWIAIHPGNLSGGTFKILDPADTPILRALGGIFQSSLGAASISGCWLG
jgi:hypothetical protein